MGAEALPGGTSDQMAAVGDFGPLEGPTAFATIVRDFLRSETHGDADGPV